MVAQTQTLIHTNMSFIVFKTLSQAKNYVKKQPDYHMNEGCGCCSTSYFHTIDNDLVVYISMSERAGDVRFDRQVVGRIKKKKGVSA